MSDSFLAPFVGAQTPLNSRTWGPLKITSVAFTPASDGDLMIEVGEPFTQERPLIRIHSECVFSEAFDSDLCDCGDQLHDAFRRMLSEGHGIIFYLRFDGRGAGLAAKVKATALEVQGVDTFESRVQIGVPPEGRDFHAIGSFLKDYGVRKARLLTNNPLKRAGLVDFGIDVVTEPLIVSDPSEKVRRLYSTKALKFAHDIPPEYRAHDEAIDQLNLWGNPENDG